MALVPISKVNIGDKIDDQVLTKRGSLLLSKGTVVTERELEILRAFLIPAIKIESRQHQAESEASSQVRRDPLDQSPTPLQLEYEKMLVLFRKVMFSLRSGGSLPLLELRKGLESLLEYGEQYHPLKFTPRLLLVQDYLLHNSLLVALTSYQLAKWQSLSPKDWIPVALAGLLHDIGNARVDDNILEKKGELTEQEWEELRGHTIHGYQMLKNVAGLNEGIKLCALQHHEREDGSGYPLSITGDRIHAYSKIVAVADVFHALTSPRFHKKPLYPYQGLDQLQVETQGKLDRELVQTFVWKTTEFSSSTIIRLNNGDIGTFAFSNRNYPTRPWINVNGRIVNLIVETNLHIEEVIDY